MKTPDKPTKVDLEERRHPHLASPFEGRGTIIVILEESRYLLHIYRDDEGSGGDGLLTADY